MKTVSLFSALLVGGLISALLLAPSKWTFVVDYLERVIKVTGDRGNLQLILFGILVGVLAGVVVGAFLLAGFLGLGILGLIVGFMAQRIELEKDGAVSNVMTTSLYAQQIKAQETRTRAESAERRAENETLLKWLFIPKVVSAGLIILGFGLFFLFQLE